MGQTWGCLANVGPRVPAGAGLWQTPSPATDSPGAAEGREAGREGGRQRVILGNQEVRSCCLNAAT